MGSMHRERRPHRFPIVRALRHRDGCEILLGEGRGFRYPGPVGSLIHARWQHYLDEGYDEVADGYINGVLDGIRHRISDEAVEAIIGGTGCREFIVSDGES